MDERREKNRIRFAESEGDERSGGAAPPSGGGARGSFGSWLRTQREARGVTIDAIAETSKISRRYLEALETDRFDALPAPVFVRGFLREYARIVGLDSDEVANFYLHARPSPKERPPAGSEARPSADRRPSAPHGSLIGYGVLLAALLALFVGIAAAISWWAGRESEEPETSAETTVVAPATEQPVTLAGEGEPHGNLDLGEQPQTAQPPLAAAGEEPLRIELEFLQDCWVDVVVDGRRRESELKAGGEILVLEAEEYVLLTLGNAPAVRVEVDGEPYALAREGSRVVRELRIDRGSVERRGAASSAPSPVR